ncbi:hypothetical protein CJ030_MR0G003158 [Morella rubra]|uniref:Uncharacterized protein n=1 Tax=Morella rubra TaxID=262757 RepID=A0A6A1UN00_9ROSI|nr:hypothetical protein CJ030_MR0G003152 [Morella rubra]KAB1201563.1 hypothetical protein CJ030_MR0G003158 [Morella rubra]
MDSPRVSPEAETLSPSSSGRRSSCSASPEFEFWMVRNPSFPQPKILSADELFVGGVLLPLHLVPQNYNHHPDPPGPKPEPEPEPPNSNPPVSDPEKGRSEVAPSAITESTAVFTASKRWRDIFKKSSTKNQEEKEKDKKKGEKDRKCGSGASSAELNINIWPFSRSRSAGNAGTRPKSVTGAPITRKVNSAPCSRSNSAGESKARKWPSSPGRAGVHLGRSSPVWQVRRGSGSGLKSSEPVARGAERTAKKDVPDTRRARTAANSGGSGPKARVLNLNVPMCIGYRHHLSCRSDENSAIGGGGSGNNSRRISSTGDREVGGSGNGTGNGGNLFNLRSLFTKKILKVAIQIELYNLYWQFCSISTSNCSYLSLVAVGNGGCRPMAYHYLNHTSLSSMCN